MDKTIPVRNVIEAWRTLDIELMVDQLAEDAVFENVPMDPIVGREAIRTANSAFIAMCNGAPWKILNMVVAEDSGTVLTERLDIFELKDGRTVYCPAMGAWTVDENNKITRWRDYYDGAGWNRMMGADPEFGAGDGTLKAIIAQ